MEYKFSRFFAPVLVMAVLLMTTVTQSSCSRKSGCPAEDLHSKTDENGIPKSGKIRSGLLPPKASKKAKKS